MYINLLAWLRAGIEKLIIEYHIPTTSAIEDTLSPIPCVLPLAVERLTTANPPSPLFYFPLPFLPQTHGADSLSALHQRCDGRCIVNARAVTCCVRWLSRKRPRKKGRAGNQSKIIEVEVLKQQTTSLQVPAMCGPKQGLKW